MDWPESTLRVLTVLPRGMRRDGGLIEGLGAHLLYLRATDFGARQPDKPALHAGLWAQAALDNAATVAQALR